MCNFSYTHKIQFFSYIETIGFFSMSFLLYQQSPSLLFSLICNGWHNILNFSLIWTSYMQTRPSSLLYPHNTISSLIIRVHTQQYPISISPIFSLICSLLYTHYYNITLLYPLYRLSYMCNYRSFLSTYDRLSYILYFPHTFSYIRAFSLISV